VCQTPGPHPSTPSAGIVYLSSRHPASRLVQIPAVSDVRRHCGVVVTARPKAATLSASFSPSTSKTRRCPWSSGRRYGTRRTPSMLQTQAPCALRRRSRKRFGENRTASNKREPCSSRYGYDATTATEGMRSRSCRPTAATTCSGVHAAKQWTRTRPSSPTAIESDGRLSSCAGHRALHPRSVRVTSVSLERIAGPWFAIFFTPFGCFPRVACG